MRPVLAKLTKTFSREKKIVVKPGDGQQGADVRFFARENFPGAARYIQTLTRDGRNPLVEPFVEAATLNINGQPKDWNLRVFVSRDRNNQPVVSDMEVRIDKPGGPVNISLSAEVITFDALVHHLGLTLAQGQLLKEKITRLSLNAFTAVVGGVAELESIPANQQQDFMGIDVIVPLDADGEFTPRILEVNDHHSGGMWDLDHVTPVDVRGRSSKDFAATMHRRALEYFKQKGHP